MLARLQGSRAVPLLEQDIAISEKIGDKKNTAIPLGNVATQQLVIGELAAAERNLRRRIEICGEIKDELHEAIGHQNLGCVLAYRGEFAEAERELAISMAYCQKTNDAQRLSLDWAYRALRALLMGNPSAALSAARKAREFADETARDPGFVYPIRDFVVAEWLIGAALTLTLTLSRRPNSPTGEGTLAEAERHLQEALARDRKIGMIDIEAAILLEFAPLRFAQAKTADKNSGQPSAVSGRMAEAYDFAHEALEIVERCEYRLQEAEIHNSLAEWHVQQGIKGAEACPERSRREQGRKESLKKAREHAGRAKERAWCDGPPYHYKVAYERAEHLLKSLEELQ